MIRTMIVRLVVDDAGQDLIEYALLSGIIGIVGVGIFPTIADKMGDAYRGWVTGARSAWKPDPPSGSP